VGEKTFLEGKMISWQDYQSTYIQISEVRTDEHLKELHLRIQRVGGRVPLAVAMWVTYCRLRMRLIELGQQDRRKKVWKKEYPKVSAGFHRIEGAMAMLLATLENQSEQLEKVEKDHKLTPLQKRTLKKMRKDYSYDSNRLGVKQSTMFALMRKGWVFQEGDRWCKV